MSYLRLFTRRIKPAVHLNKGVIRAFAKGFIRITLFQFIVSINKPRYVFFIGSETQRYQYHPKLTAYKVELAQVEAEIEKLLDTLIGGNKTLLAYANSRIEELDEKKQSLLKAIADMSVEAVSPEQIKRITGYLDDWDNTGFDEKRQTVGILITVINATSDDLDIKWNF